MWTPATRRRHSREHLRYASDVSDEEWALLEPHLPAPCLTGRPRAADEGDRERDLLRAPIRLRLAALARQLPAAADGLRLVPAAARRLRRSEEHTSELQSHVNIVCRLLLEKKNSRGHARKSTRQGPAPNLLAVRGRAGHY